MFFGQVIVVFMIFSNELGCKSWFSVSVDRQEKIQVRLLSFFFPYILGGYVFTAGWEHDKLTTQP